MQPELGGALAGSTLISRPVLLLQASRSQGLKHQCGQEVPRGNTHGDRRNNDHPRPRPRSDAAVLGSDFERPLRLHEPRTNWFKTRATLQSYALTRAVGHEAACKVRNHFNDSSIDGTRPHWNIAERAPENEERSVEAEKRNCCTNPALHRERLRPRLPNDSGVSCEQPLHRRSVRPLWPHAFTSCSVAIAQALGEALPAVARQLHAKVRLVVHA
jgi:hypothetical protein